MDSKIAPQQYIDQPVYIEDSDTLAQYCGRWMQCELLALDTEFIRTDTFYPKGALLQISDGIDCFLIDPLAIDDFSPLVAILIDPGIVKVVHSCSEDLEVFECLFGVVPSPLIDTQIAAGMDGHGFSLGYQAMTQALLGIHVEKGETRSNWLQRPLTASQIHYAALDVAYLPAMYHLLLDSLTAKGRLDWLHEECRGLVEIEPDEQKISQYYKKVKSAWKLSARELTFLQLLTTWREQLARDKNMPRGRVLKDRCCFDLARLRPTAASDLGAVKELPGQFVRRYGETVMSMVVQAANVASEHCVESLPRPLPPESNSLVKALKSHVLSRAEQLRLAPEVLARKRDYEALLRSGAGGSSYQLPLSLSGWRRGVIGDELLALARGRK